MNREPHVERWLDDFFRFFYASQPVDATFIGVHEHDHALPDWSEHGMGDALADMQDLLRRAPGIAAGRGTSSEPADPAVVHAAALESAGVAGLDARLASGHMRLRSAELESTHFERGNPALYTGEAVFGVLSLLLTDFAPHPERIVAATERLAAIRQLLAQGKENLRQAPAAWTERALTECTGALAFLTGGVERRRAAWTRDGLPAGLAGAFQTAAAGAARAFTDFGQWLESTLHGRRSSAEGCGPELFARALRDGHALAEDADAIEAAAIAQLARARREVGVALHRAGFRDDAAALEALAAQHPPVDRYLARHREMRDEVQQLVERTELVTWPDDPVRFAERPDWARAAAPHLYFLVYRAPAAFGRPPVHDVLIPPIDTDLPAEQQAALLRATNDSVIRLNHVIHHAAVGHHVQNGHACRSSSRIGRVAAVDGASRIALYCGGTMAEGWACYATDLMAEAGALTPLERVAEARSLVRMCVRAIVDVRLHHGRLSITDAATFYEREAGMDPGPARREAVRNSMFPGTALMYLAGRNRIHELRAGMEARMGSRFLLRDFHDALLSYGSIPVSIVAAHLERGASGSEVGMDDGVRREVGS